MTVAIEREAACSCGQLRVRAVGDPRIVSSCHCLACQRRTGALFGATAFFPRSQIAATEGAYKTWRRRGDSAVGAFADPAFPRPARSVWTANRHDWLAFPDDIACYREGPLSPTVR